MTRSPPLFSGLISIRSHPLFSSQPLLPCPLPPSLLSFSSLPSDRGTPLILTSRTNVAERRGVDPVTRRSSQKRMGGRKSSHATGTHTLRRNLKNVCDPNIHSLCTAVQSFLSSLPNIQGEEDKKKERKNTTMNKSYSNRKPLL